MCGCDFVIWTLCGSGIFRTKDNSPARLVATAAEDRLNIKRNPRSRRLRQQRNAQAMLRVSCCTGAALTIRSFFCAASVDTDWPVAGRSLRLP
jgi:hypothetical protein